MVRTRRPAQTVPEPAPEPDTMDTLPSNVVAFPLWPGMKAGEPAPRLTSGGDTICAVDVTSAQICAAGVTEETGKNRSSGRGLKPALSPSQVRENEGVSPTRANVGLTRAAFLALVKSLSAMELRRRFPLDANTHRDMIGRRRKEYAGCEIAPEFRSFRSFLQHMGQARPSPDWTLDRLDPSRMEYGPGLVRWADKREQANNRRSTRLVRSARGDIRPLTEHADGTGQKANTIRQRLRRGWTQAEAVAGRRGVPSPDGPDPVRPPRPATTWPEGTKDPSAWEAAWLDFRRNFLRSDVSRAAFMVWLYSNIEHHARERLRNEFRTFQEGYDPEPEGYADHPDLALVEIAEVRIQAAYRDIAGDRQQHDQVSILIKRWPDVQTYAQARQLRPREDNE